MAYDLHLYIGSADTSFDFKRDSKEWQEVREQIAFAMSNGRGTISIPRSGQGRIVYVYNDSLAIRWVETKD